MQIIHSVLLLVFSTLLIACSETKLPQDSHNQNSENSSSSITPHTISGSVIEEIQQGRDGTVWTFKGDNGQTYSLLVSIPNLGQEQSKNISLVRPNKRLEIVGEVLNLDGETRLIAKQIKAVE